MEEYRLQKFLASCGVASRRASEEIIAAGKVYVNGHQITDPAVKVTEKDRVTVNGKPVHITRTKIYIMVNKPQGVLSSVSDDRERKCVVDLVDMPKARLFPVGRLDFDTTGLILLTNDGKFMQRITHPKYEMWKTYEAVVKGEPTEEDLQKLREGIVLTEEDGEEVRTLPARADIIRFKGNNAVVKIMIREGRNRQVRRMLEAIKFPVIKLKRVALGGLELGDLQTGSWRQMNRQDFIDLLGKTEAKKYGFN